MGARITRTQDRAFWDLYYNIIFAGGSIIETDDARQPASFRFREFSGF